MAEFQPGVYRGQRGRDEIQLELHLEPDAEDSVEGWYFVFGDSTRVLLAGEFADGHLSMEESRNGTDVSGTWLGDLGAAGISGTWRDAAETVELPFQLVRLDARKPG